MKEAYIYHNGDFDWLSTSEPDTAELNTSELTIWRVRPGVIERWSKLDSSWEHMHHNGTQDRFIYRYPGGSHCTSLKPGDVALSSEGPEILRLRSELVFGNFQVKVERWNPYGAEWRELTKMKRLWVIV